MIELIDRLFKDPANSTAIVLRGLNFVTKSTSTHEEPSAAVDYLCWELSKCLGNLASAG